MAEQLYIFQPERHPLDFSKFQTPLHNRCGAWYDGQYSIGRFAYYESESEMIVLSPFALRLSFWKDDKTPEGELKTSLKGLPEREKEIWRQRLLEGERESAEYFANLPEVKPRKPRKGYKWSKAAIARNRRKRMRQRIEKRHGYNPNRPDIFQDEILADIESEYQTMLYQHPEYYAGESIDYKFSITGTLESEVELKETDG